MTAALLAAPAVVFNRASSGVYIEDMLRQLGLLDRLAPRVVRTDTGAEVVQCIATDAPSGSIGFGQSTEIRRLASTGVRLLGVLPEPVAHATAYEAVLLRSGAPSPEADAFLAFLGTAQARALLARAGVE